MKRLIIDIESNNLLAPALDYTELPFKLKDDYRVWCVVVRDIDTGAVRHLVQGEVTRENMQKLVHGATELIGHNIVGFDFPVLQLYGVFDYRIGYPGEPSTVFGSPVEITDTLLWSKLLNADRTGGHSLKAWGKILKNFKGDYNDWTQFSQGMLDYCIQDTNTNRSIYFKLLDEKKHYDWERAYSMEIKLADLTLRQELFGFELDRELAEANLIELDGMMEEIALKVNPLLPMKKLTQGKLNGFIPPKIQLKKDGTVSSHMLKFIEKHGMDWEVPWDKTTLVYKGQTFTIPFEDPLETHEIATVNDIDVVKGYLLSLGWVPTEVKERDLVKNLDKSKKSYEEIIESIDRYVKQTEGSLFKDLRLDLLDCSMDDLKYVLTKRVNGNKPIYVPTTPRLTIGLEKEICPNLISLGEKAAFVKDVVHYYTYRHRRNSIAGGEVDDDGEPETGFISFIRDDGRVPTPADTLGANTGRYRHKIVCNIPRVTSLYGEQMRNMFRAGRGLWQLGYDFASLEARVMGHYVLPYTDGVALAAALIAEKPNDIHSINGRKLGIARNEAKSFSYAAIYGAQPKKLAKMLGITEHEAKILFNEYWDAVIALKELKEKVEGYWETTGRKMVIPGLDGRMLNTRSKHSLINVLFQSGGAIAAKWSAVRLAQAMEREGILGDPFVHTIDEHKCWWLIHMHDEQQMAVHPKLLNVKNFATDEEAEAGKEEGCSAIGHGRKGPYIAYKTSVVECIDEGIKSAVSELGLRVDLGFEYIVGGSWGQCH